MNGRCETDPFEKATDVCGMCYGDFCDSCLVSLKRRKYPLCKECAVIASGIRGGGKPKRRGDKKTAKERREYFASSGPGDEIIRYFDVDLDPTDLIPAEAIVPAAEPVKDRSKRTPRKKKGKRAKSKTPTSDQLAGGTDPVEGEVPGSAVDQLHKLREEGKDGVGPPVALPDGDEPIADSVSEPKNSARKSDKPTPSPEPVAKKPPVARRPAKPRPKPKSRKVDGPKLGDLIEPKVPPSPPKPAKKARKAKAVVDSKKPPAWTGASRSKAKPDAPVAQASESSFEEPVKQIDKSPFETSVPDPEPQDEVIDPLDPELVSVAVGAAAASKPQSSERVELGSSDIDPRGEWVPPLLRGIAPDADEAKSSLPSRRKTDGKNGQSS